MEQHSPQNDSGEDKLTQWLRQGFAELAKNPVKGFELIIQCAVIVALAFAVIQLEQGATNLKQNAENIKIANRVQLYTSDVGLSKEQFDEAGGKIWSIYSKPDTLNPTNYCQQLLGLLTTDTNIISISNAETLFEVLVRTNSF